MPPPAGVAGILKGFGKKLACSAYRHGDTEELIDHRDSDVDPVVIVTVIAAIVVIDMLFHHPFAGVIIPVGMPIPMAVFWTMPIIVLVGVAPALFPAVMVSGRGLGAVMIPLVIAVILATPALFRPCVAPQCQRKSHQCDANH